MENALVLDSAFIVGMSTSKSMGIIAVEPKNAQPNDSQDVSPMLMPNGMANRASAIGIIDKRNTDSGAPTEFAIACAMCCTNSVMRVSTSITFIL